MYREMRNTFLVFGIVLSVALFSGCVGEKLSTSQVPEKVVDAKNISEDRRTYNKEYEIKAGDTATASGN